MYRSKAWLLGVLTAGLLAGFAGTALGHGPQEQSGMHYGYGMGQDMMMGPGMGRDGGMRPGMHDGRGHGQGMHYGMHHQRGMHPSMQPGMHPGMHGGRGCGQGMHYGMHHQRGMHPGMHQAQRPGMHPGYGMMMGPGTGKGMGPGTGKGMGPGLIYGRPADGEQNISVEDARGWLDRRLAWHGNPRLKLGEVREMDEDTIVAEIVTQDGSLVQKLAIDRRSGVLRQLDD